MKPHATIPGWLVDDDGNVFARVRKFGCPNHPYGPDREDGDEFTACERLALYLLDELQPEAICTVAPGATRELVQEAHIELGRCCAGHRWRDTGDLREVGSLELFIAVNMHNIRGPIADSRRGDILFNELNRGPHSLQGGRVHIPLIVNKGTPLPKTAAATSYDLDNPGAPATPKETP